MMDWYYSAGTAAALEKLGAKQLMLPFSAGEKSKNFFMKNPALIIGALTGTGLAANALTSGEQASPRMEPPRYEGNPLLSNMHY
jgi:hypothetical protein